MVTGNAGINHTKNNYRMGNMRKNPLEHKFVSNRNTPNVIGAKCFNSILKNFTLTLVSSTIVRCNDKVSNPNRNIDLGFLNSIELRKNGRENISEKAMKDDVINTFTTKAVWLQSAP